MAHTRLLCLALTALAVLTAQIATAQKLVVAVKVYKKNMTGARSMWEMDIRDDLSVTLNSKLDKPIGAEELEKIKKLIADIDWAAWMKTRSTEGYASSKGGMDYQYRVKLEKGMAQVSSWDQQIDPQSPFVKEMMALLKVYPPTFSRMR